MKMRDKKRAQAARTRAVSVVDGLPEVVAAVTEIRRARVAMLREPGALAEMKRTIRGMRGPGARVMRKLLAEDVRLMRVMDRQGRRRA